MHERAKLSIDCNQDERRRLMSSSGLLMPNRWMTFTRQIKYQEKTVQLLRLVSVAVGKGLQGKLLRVVIGKAEGFKEPSAAAPS